MIKYSEIINRKMKDIITELKDMIRLAIDAAGFKEYKPTKNGFFIRDEFLVVDIEIKPSAEYCFISYNPRILDIPITPRLTHFGYNYSKVKDLTESLQRLEKLIKTLYYSEEFSLKLRELRYVVRGISYNK